MSVDIEPYQLVYNVVKIKLDVPVLILNERAIIRVLMFDENEVLIKTDTFELIKPDYNLWLSDENLIDYVCNRYGFTKTSI